MKKSIQIESLEPVGIVAGAYCDPITGECFPAQVSDTEEKKKRPSHELSEDGDPSREASSPVSKIE